MRIVVKIGSNLLTSGSGLNEKRIASLCSAISELHSGDRGIAVVSSGAVAAGMKRLGLKRRPTDIRHKQAAAAAGQSALIWAYERAFSAHDKKVAQILITRDAFYDRTRYINAKNTILTLMDHGIIPVINENDTVAIDEIKFGDNDQLASLVSGMLSADRLIILSDVDGLYTKDPKKHKDARLIPSVEEITPDLINTAGKAGSEAGTGGMLSKLLAAKQAMRFGTTVHIISGKRPGLIKSVLRGNNPGTEFIPGEKRISSRKGWIAFSLRTKGSLTIDDGAKEAIISRGKSLLPSGITGIEGNFKSGDAVYCIDKEGRRVAKGLTNYSAGEVDRIKGARTSHIERILGYRYSDEIIHRDNMVLL